MNGRLGNTLLLTPLLQGIADALPLVRIDLVLAYPRGAELLGPMPAVDRAITLPHKRWWDLSCLLGVLRAVRAQHYDLAIDPCVNSASGRLALMFCRARWRLGFGGAEQWAPLTHAVPIPTRVRHEALRPLLLLEHGLNYVTEPALARLSLELSDEELRQGRRDVAASLGKGVRTRCHPAEPIGFFAHAAGGKRLSRDWWLAFWKAFLERAPVAVPLEFLPWADNDVVSASYARLNCGSPRRMAAAMAATRMFISADTGPMHLASATAVPTVALFTITDPRCYGPLKPYDLSVAVSRETPETVAQTCVGVLKNLDRSRDGGTRRFGRAR